MALILIVEDAQVTRRMIGKILLAEGHTLLEASNGREGLEIALERHPDCILLDLLMPELEGQEVLMELQARNVTIPAIVLSADIQETTRQQCLNLGAIAVLNKPPKAGEINSAVQKALNIGQENAL